MQSTSIVLVPGSFAQPDLYDIYVAPLISEGYDVHAVKLRSALTRDATPPGRPLPTMYDDAAAIADRVKQLSEQGKGIIVVAHSYGGTPASEGIRGYSKAARQKEGKPGGVVRLAYITCLVGDVGQSAGELLKTKTENRIPAELNVRPSLDSHLPLTEADEALRPTAGCTTRI
jgi:pimeloyl-ACP methyl ester carboxylesterase